MSQQMLHHGYTPGHHLWLCLAVAGVPALSTLAAVAKECGQETPLPANVRLTTPSAAVSEAIAQFAGAWNGPSESPRSADALCHTLVVEEVLANGLCQDPLQL